MTKQTIWGRSMRGLSRLAVVTLGFTLVAPAALADKGADHKGLNTFFGVSVSGIEFLLIDGNEYCYAGTAGALVEDVSGTKYILSNNHVLAEENAAISDLDIIQPGLLDANGDSSSCGAPGGGYSSLVVGNLTDWVPLDFTETSYNDNVVDAAIAALDLSTMDPHGRILDIGGISSTTADAAVRMRVQKSGRTSGYTTGKISAVNANIRVNYGDSGTALFEHQIVVSGDKGSAFIVAGDSGSLLVTRSVDADGLPQAVGLLFAGSPRSAIANPIGDVLSELGVSMVGCDDSETDCSDTGVAGGGGGDGDGGGGAGKKGGGPDCAANPDHKKCNAGASNVFGLEVAAEVRDLHQSDLMSNPDVVGTGLSFDENGEPVIQVYTRGSRRSASNPLPSELDGVKVQVIVTGEFKAL